MCDTLGDLCCVATNEGENPYNIDHWAVKNGNLTEREKEVSFGGKFYRKRCPICVYIQLRPCWMEKSFIRLFVSPVGFSQHKQKLKEIPNGREILQ